jgi:hypothetical protein
LEHCSKYDLNVTGCSKQTSLFKPDICAQCLSAIGRKPPLFYGKKVEATNHMERYAFEEEPPVPNDSLGVPSYSSAVDKTSQGDGDLDSLDTLMIETL